MKQLQNCLKKRDVSGSNGTKHRRACKSINLKFFCFCKINFNVLMRQIAAYIDNNLYIYSNHKNINFIVWFTLKLFKLIRQKWANLEKSGSFLRVLSPALSHDTCNCLITKSHLISILKFSHLFLTILLIGVDFTQLCFIFTFTHST